MTAPSLFGKNHRNGCRAVVTGQVGVDKKPFLRKVISLAEQRGHHVTLCNVGDSPEMQRAGLLPPLPPLSSGFDVTGCSGYSGP